MTALDPAPVELLSAAVDGALWCDPAGVIRSGELDVTDQVKAAERTGLLLLGVDQHGNEVWIPSRFGEWVLRRAAAETMPVQPAPASPPPSRLLVGVVRLALRVMLRAARQ